MPSRRSEDSAWYAEILLHVLRDRLGLTGTKFGCAHGQCGACTVHIDGEPVCSCLELAANAVGAEIVTIEGYNHPDGGLTRLQQAFVKHGALQCGYCTPGFIMSAAAFIADHPNATEDDIREGMVGNLCRCTGYGRIIAAIKDAAAVSDGLPMMRADQFTDPSAVGIGTSRQRPDAHRQSARRVRICARPPRGRACCGALRSARRTPMRGSWHVDLKPAQAMPGRQGRARRLDVPDNRFGAVNPDQPVLVDDYVRYVGEPIAIVAAIDARDRAPGRGRHQGRVRAARSRSPTRWTRSPRARFTATSNIRHGDPSGGRRGASRGRIFHRDGRITPSWRPTPGLRGPTAAAASR